jgi:hypothetical protein
MTEEEESSGVGLGICSWTRCGSTKLLISGPIAPVLRRDAKLGLPRSNWLMRQALGPTCGSPSQHHRFGGRGWSETRRVLFFVIPGRTSHASQSG